MSKNANNLAHNTSQLQHANRRVENNQRNKVHGPHFPVRISYSFRPTESSGTCCIHGFRTMRVKALHGLSVEKTVGSAHGPNQLWAETSATLALIFGENKFGVFNPPTPQSVCVVRSCLKSKCFCFVSSIKISQNGGRKNAISA